MFLAAFLAPSMACVTGCDCVSALLCGNCRRLGGCSNFSLRWVTGKLSPYFHRFCCWLFGIEVVVEGVRAETLIDTGERAPVLYVTNHASYLDVLVLGGITRGVFTAKS